MMNAEDTVRGAMETALKAGASQVRISLEKDEESSATVINNKVDKLLSCSDSTLYLQIFKDGRYGSFSTNMLRREELAVFIKSAVEATSLMTVDNCRRLPDAKLCFHGPSMELGQYDSRIRSLTMQDRIERAMAVSREIWGREKRLLSVEAEWGDDTEYCFTADSQGFEGESLISNHTVSASVSIKGRGDEKPESWWYESGIMREDAVVEGCGCKALQRALDRLNPKKIKSGKYNAVVSSTVASKLVSPIIRALSGASLQQDNSFLKGSLGKKIFGDNLSLYDRPFTAGLPGSRLFDGDGIATRERTIIGEGIVENWFISTYYGLKMNIPVTVDAPSVLEFGQKQKKELNLQDLVKKVGNGILISDFNGGNCNPATGDFSYGVCGFLFENGEKVHPIREMNISGNMIELWNRFISPGCDNRKCSKWNLPSLAFEDVDFSGI